MKTEKFDIGETATAGLANVVGRELMSYCSDMSRPDRAFEVLVLRFGDFDIEMRISGIENESDTEWIREMSKVDVSKTSLEKVVAPAGQIDKDGNYIPNPFNSYPVGKRVEHVSVVTERILRDMHNGEGEILTVTRGIVLDIGDSFIAFDKVESWGEVWTITTGRAETYVPQFTAKDDESPEFTTTVEVNRIA